MKNIAITISFFLSLPLTACSAIEKTNDKNHIYENMKVIRMLYEQYGDGEWNAVTTEKRVTARR